MTPHGIGRIGGNKVRIDRNSADIKLPDYQPVRRYGDVFTGNGINRKGVR